MYKMKSFMLAIGACFVLCPARAYSSPTSLTPKAQISGIHWGPCSPDLEALKTYDTPLDCGNLTVPLDYGDTTKGTIELNLLRARAPRGPSKGSVLINYGGPGEVGRANLPVSLPWGLTLTGFVHDLVIFDPRGTANTIPLICYNETEFPGNAQSNSNASDTANGEIWVGANNTANACLVRNGTIGAYMGTAAVARDLISVVDALSEDGLLNYYGTSYGTVLGATAAAMFPDRIGKMYLDGLANAHEYYHSVDVEWIIDADKVWADFFAGCAASPLACPLARDNKTAQQLEDDFYQWLYGLKQEPFSTGVTSMQTYSSIKAFIFDYLYHPARWHNVSQILNAAYQHDAALFDELVAALPAIAGAAGNAVVGIKCSDKILRMDNYEAWLPKATELLHASKISGDAAVSNQATCAQWKMPAVEVYKGDFCVKTKTPILMASNEFDPVTPFVSARNMSASIQGSFLLVNKNGHGHTTRQQPSACILEHVAKYFVTGELPAPDTVCEPSAPLFGNVTEVDVLEMVNGKAK